MVLEKRENQTEEGRRPTQQKKELNLSVKVLFYICIILASANWTSHPCLQIVDEKGLFGTLLMNYTSTS